MLLFNNVLFDSVILPGEVEIKRKEKGREDKEIKFFLEKYEKTKISWRDL